MENLGTIILATGALGTASFGIVEILKGIVWIGDFGFGRLMQRLKAFEDPFRIAFGSDFERYLLALYRTDHKELERALRQGIRIGLVEENASHVAASVGVVRPADLTSAVKFQTSADIADVELKQEDEDEHRRILGRFDLAVDARIDAALCDALRIYENSIRVAAVFVSFAIALSVGWYLESIYPVGSADDDAGMLLRAALIGLVAVPIAPVTKDLVTAVTSASKALGVRS